MKITRIETIRLGDYPNLLFVGVHTDQGLVGLNLCLFPELSTLFFERPGQL